MYNVSSARVSCFWTCFAAIRDILRQLLYLDEGEAPDEQTTELVVTTRPPGGRNLCIILTRRMAPNIGTEAAAPASPAKLQPGDLDTRLHIATGQFFSAWLLLTGTIQLVATGV
jgi:hypothetical protein